MMEVNIVNIFLGIMDLKAAFNDNCWKIVLDEEGLDEITLRDKRYDVVMHLVTVALGALDRFE